MSLLSSLCIFFGSTALLLLAYLCSRISSALFLLALFGGDRNFSSALLQMASSCEGLILWQDKSLSEDKAISSAAGHSARYRMMNLSYH